MKLRMVFTWLLSSICLSSCAAHSLSTRTEELLELMEAPCTESCNSQIAAIKELAKRQDPDSVEPLIELLQKFRREEEVRLQAIRTLGHLKDKRAFKPLSRRLRHGRSDRIRLAALHAIALYGTEVPPLIFARALYQPNIGIAGQAARYLKRYPDEAAVAAMLTLLAHPDYDFEQYRTVKIIHRELAARKEATLLKLPALMFDDAVRQSTREEIARFLGKLQGKLAGKKLLEAARLYNPPLQRAAIQGLIAMQAKAVPYLQSIVSDQRITRDARLDAIDALSYQATVTPAATVRELTKVLAEADCQLVHAARTLLMKLHAGGMPPALMEKVEKSFARCPDAGLGG